MKKMYLVPDISESQNVYMYCNYARENPHEERCLSCDRENCNHKGKHTIIENYELYRHKPLN